MKSSHLINNLLFQNSQKWVLQTWLKSPHHIRKKPSLRAWPAIARMNLLFTPATPYQVRGDAVSNKSHFWSNLELQTPYLFVTLNLFQGLCIMTLNLRRKNRDIEKLNYRSGFNPTKTLWIILNLILQFCFYPQNYTNS